MYNIKTGWYWFTQLNNSIRPCFWNAETKELRPTENGSVTFKRDIFTLISKEPITPPKQNGAP